MDIKSFKPISFGYLKAYLNSFRNGLFEMDYLDREFDPRGYDILAISSISQNYSYAVNLAKFAKETNPGIITIIGGHHITYLPETMKPCFDLGVMGEGEAAFVELFDSIHQNDARLNKDHLAAIQGIVFNNGGQITQTPPRPLIMRLDNIPHPFRFREEAQYLVTSRGCPYKCAFCSGPAFWRKTRMFSAGYVVEEIEQILRDIPETVRIPFQDDLFIANRQRLSEIINLLESKNLSRKVRYTFSVRANLVDEDLCRTLKRFKLDYVSFGAESASDRILDILGKGTTGEMNQKAIDLLYKHRINTVCSFIVGVPGETEKEVISTYEFALKNMLGGKLSINSNIYILMPLPGTEIWNDAVKQGLITVENFDWNRLSAFTSYRTANVSSFDEWMSIRQKNNSIYLNENTLPFKIMAQIMNKYEKKIKRFENAMRWRIIRYIYKSVNYLRRRLFDEVR